MNGSMQAYTRYLDVNISILVDIVDCFGFAWQFGPSNPTCYHDITHEQAMRS